jgi:hypothetical protein
MPPPATIVTAVLASKMSLEDLGAQADDFIAKFFEETNVQGQGQMQQFGPFGLVEFTSQDANDGTPAHWKALLSSNGAGDSYIMIVGSPESDYAANLPTIDALWGGFDVLKPDSSTQ